MAGLRCRGHGTVLRVAAARGGPDQIDPAEDHRRRHRLALSERIETRAEGVNAKHRGGVQMALLHRRRFIGGLAAIGAAGVVGMPQARAAEGGLETTTVRLTKYPSICNAPQ